MRESCLRRCPSCGEEERVGMSLMRCKDCGAIYCLNCTNSCGGGCPFCGSHEWKNT